MSLLSAIGKGLVGFATGGIGGAVLGIGSELVGGGPSTSPVSAGPIKATPVPSRRPVKVQVPKAVPVNAIVQESPSILSGLQIPPPDSVVVRGSGTSIGPGGSLFATGDVSATAYYPSQGTALATCGASMRGTHLNKSTYRTLDGTLVMKGTRCVKNRRRNPLNPRALTRAISRVAAAKSFARVLDRVEIKKRGRR